MFYRIGGLRAIYQIQAENIILSINGQNYILPIDQLDDAKLLTDFPSMTSDQLKSSMESPIFIETLTTLMNEGYWFIE